MQWRSFNRWVYRAGHRWSRWRQHSAPGRRALLAGRRAAARPPNAAGPLLYLANGRIGDALLAAAFTRRYRQWFGSVVAVGRPEVQSVLAPHVDHFVALGPGRAVAAAAMEEIARRGCRAALGDLHVFHSGEALLDVAAALELPLVVYDGWIDRDRQAPFRTWPAGACVVPARDKSQALVGCAEQLHVFDDLGQWHERALAHLGLRAELPSAPELPAGLRDPAVAARLQLRAPWVACHAQSSQAKKDWPLERFAAVFAALPDVDFALLGTAGAPVPQRANVVDLRGRTTVAEAIAVAATARAFVGIDSGLAHAAAIARVPTVVVMPSATPGYFFPYPRAFGAHVTAVLSAEHRACAGCGGICSKESIWTSRRRGFACLRAVPVDAVVAALRQALR